MLVDPSLSKDEVPEEQPTQNSDQIPHIEAYHREYDEKQQGPFEKVEECTEEVLKTIHSGISRRLWVVSEEDGLSFTVCSVMLCFQDKTCPETFHHLVEKSKDD